MTTWIAKYPDEAEHNFGDDVRELIDHVRWLRIELGRYTGENRDEINQRWLAERSSNE